MVYDKVHYLYRNLPPTAKRCLRVIPLKYRLGGTDFSETSQLLEKSEEWDRDNLEQYQKERLSKVLEHAVETVPHYNDVELPYDCIYKNLQKFPIVDKETIRQNRREFISEDVNKVNTYHVTTGGTSGEPFEFRLDNSTYGTEWAFIMTGWERIGYVPGDQLITFKGVSYNNSDKNIFWNYNPIYNTYEFSPFHLKPKNMGKYINKINDIGPRFIHGYPSAITTLANYVNDENVNFTNIDGVLAASENIYDKQRDIIEDAFDARVFSHYGQSEKVALAAECEHSSKYHLYPQYGYTELLDEHGNEVNIGETGEIVGTGFLNKYMPFIRYRTGDYAVKGPIGECKCDRAYRILPEIQGREEKERLIYIDEEHTVAIHMLYYTMHGKSLENVNSIQFYQDTPGELLIRIVPKSNAESVHEQEIIDSIKGKIGRKIYLEIEYVTNVELTDSGKKKLLIREIKG